VSEPYNINKEVTDIKTIIGGLESDSKAHEDIIQVLKKSQTVLAKETVDIIEIIANKTDANQISTMKAIDDLKKEQKKWWKNLPWPGKLIFIIFGLTYVVGSYFAYVKIVAD